MADTRESLVAELVDAENMHEIILVEAKFQVLDRQQARR